jgi:hypothetical protein
MAPAAPVFAGKPAPTALASIRKASLNLPLQSQRSAKEHR